MASRNFRFGHGIGRSGEVAAVQVVLIEDCITERFFVNVQIHCCAQPKAAGSSLMVKVCSCVLESFESLAAVIIAETLPYRPIV